MKETAKQTTKNITATALFTAFTAVMSQVAIPMPFGVPLTLQTFAVAICGYVLGMKWGFASIITYILLGCVGVPVFSGFVGGIQALFNFTGGFIYGFIAFVILCGASHYMKKKFLKIAIGLAGLLICHCLGIIQFAVLYGTTFWGAALMVSVPYLIKDILSVVLAYFLSIYINKLLKRI